MSIRVTRDEREVTLTLDDQLLRDNRLELKATVLRELTRGERRFRLDFERTNSVDSEALGALVSVSQAVHARRGDIRLANVDEELRALLRVTRLDLLFPVDGAAGLELAAT